MKTVTYYVITNRRLIVSMIIGSGILLGILLDDSIIGGFGNYFDKLQCEKIVLPDAKVKCNDLRNASVEWLFIMPSISGFLSFALFARKLIWN